MWEVHEGKPSIEQYKAGHIGAAQRWGFMTEEAAEAHAAKFRANHPGEPATVRKTYKFRVTLSHKDRPGMAAYGRGMTLAEALQVAQSFYRRDVSRKAPTLMIFEELQASADGKSCNYVQIGK